jgi:hypothetical protein
MEASCGAEPRHDCRIKGGVQVEYTPELAAIEAENHRRLAMLQEWCVARNMRKASAKGCYFAQLPVGSVSMRMLDASEPADCAFVCDLRQDGEASSGHGETPGEAIDAIPDGLFKEAEQANRECQAKIIMATAVQEFAATINECSCLFYGDGGCQCKEAS